MVDPDYHSGRPGEQWRDHRATKGGIAVKPTAQPEFELAPSEANTYFHKGAKVTVRCVPGADGAVNSFQVLQGGATIEFAREAAKSAPPANSP